MQHPQIHGRKLSHQAATDADIGGFRAGEEQRAVCHGARSAPSHRGAAVRREEALPRRAVALRHDRQRAIKCHSLAETFDFHRHDDAGWQVEFEFPPISRAGDGDDEIHLDREFTGSFGHEIVALLAVVFPKHHMPAISRDAT